MRETYEIVVLYPVVWQVQRLAGIWRQGKYSLSIVIQEQVQENFFIFSVNVCPLV